MSDTKSKPLKMISELPQLKETLKHLMIVILIISISQLFFVIDSFRFRDNLVSKLQEEC